MKTVGQILTENTCNQIWEKIFKYEKEKKIDLGAYGNGFDRKGKAYLDDLIRYYPEYANEILELF